MRNDTTNEAPGIHADQPDGVCPHCGYCRHCGRHNAAPIYVPMPYYPQPIGPGPVWAWPTVTITPASTLSVPTVWQNDGSTSWTVKHTPDPEGEGIRWNFTSQVQS